jgi:hypothetical protein
MPPRAKRKGTYAGESMAKRTRTINERANLDNIQTLLCNFEDKAPEKGDIWMALECVLDSAAFGSVVTQHGPQECLPAQSLPLVTREYEEAFMRECYLPDDTECVMGDFCECALVGDFCGVAFVLPQISTVSPRMCVLCIRKTTQLLFYRVVASGMQTTQMLQMYGNICGIPGEYHESAMLTVPPCGPVHSMPLPVVAHQRNRYYAEKDADGVRRIRQRNVYYEDFQ